MAFSGWDSLSFFVLHLPSASLSGSFECGSIYGQSLQWFTALKFYPSLAHSLARPLDFSPWPIQFLTHHRVFI